MKNSPLQPAIRVRRTDTGEIFESISKCARQCGVSRDVLKNRLRKDDGRTTLEGIEFEYVRESGDDVKVSDPEHFLANEKGTFVRDVNKDICLIKTESDAAYIRYDQLSKPRITKAYQAIEGSVIRQTAREMAENKVNAYIEKKEKEEKIMESKANFDELIKEIECVLTVLNCESENSRIVKDLALQTIYEKGKNGWIK